MTSTATVFAAMAFAVAGSAAIKPLGDLKPENNKSTVVFKTTPQGDLKVHLYFPGDWKPGDHRPGILLFFGGGFTGGAPSQFTNMAEYFASRGVVAATPEYRIRNTHHTAVDKSIEDCKSAVRWLRANARSLGIDPGRVIAGGGSAGGTCATFSAYNTSYEPEGEDKSVSSRPNALVLYNPALGFPADLSSFTPQMLEQVKTLGVAIADWKVKAGGPPAILFFGTEDNLQERARGFAGQSIAAGTPTEFYTAAGQKHGFFNQAPWQNPVIRQTDLFLASLGYLEGPPTVAVPSDSKEVLKKELP